MNLSSRRNCDDAMIVPGVADWQGNINELAMTSCTLQSPRVQMHHHTPARQGCRKQGLQGLQG